MTARAACCRSAARAPPQFCGAWYHPCDTAFSGHGRGGITRMIPLALARIPIGIHPVRRIFPLGFLLESIPQNPACLPAFYPVGAVPALRPKPPCVRGFGAFAGGLTQHIRKECCYDKF